MDPKDLFDPATGFYTHAQATDGHGKRATSVEFLSPWKPGDIPVERRRTRTRRVQPGSQQSKHGLHLYFRSEYGDSSSTTPFFGPTGTSSFQQFDLRTFNNYSWSYGGGLTLHRPSRPVLRDTQQPWAGSRTRRLLQPLHQRPYWGIYNSANVLKPTTAPVTSAPARKITRCQVALNGLQHRSNRRNLDAGPACTRRPGRLTVAAELPETAGQQRRRNAHIRTRFSSIRKNLIDYMLTIYYTEIWMPRCLPSSATPAEQSFAVRNRNGNMGFQYFATIPSTHSSM